MENNENNPIKDYGKLSFRRMVVTFCEVLIIVSMIRYIYTIFFVLNNERKEIEQNRIETSIILEENNSKVTYVYDFYDEHFNINRMTEIEYDNGIKIPTLRKYKYVDAITSYTTATENNIIAEYSPVVKVTYKNDMFVDMFKDNIVKKDGYTIVPHNKNTEEKVFVREELNGYFSYVIINGCEVTFGICFGEPKIR